MQPRTAESVSAESVSQAGAGALLSAVGLVELALGIGAAGWSYRAGAAAVALIGAVLLVRGILAIVASPHPPREDVGRAPAVPYLR